MDEATEKALVRRLAEFIHATGHEAANRSNPPHYNAARALLAAGLIDRDALSGLSDSE